MKIKKENHQKLNLGRKIAFTATGITLLLTLMKLIIGYIFNSSILIADAVHSAADSIAILASGLGLWLAGKKKSQKFPYGLYKVETLISFMIGLLIIWGGIEIIQDGYKTIFQVPSRQIFPFYSILATLISIVTTYFIAVNEKKVGNLINSASLLANAKESFLDIIISGVVLAGLVLNYSGIPYIEGIIIIIISLFIFKLGLETVWDSLLVLIDANLDQNLQAELEKKLITINGVKGINDIKIRQSGPFKIVNCTLLISPQIALHKAHVLADKVEYFITNNYKHIDSVFIHLEPGREKMISALIPVSTIDGLVSKVYPLFGRAPQFIILHFDKNSFYIEKILDNHSIAEKQYIGVKVVKQLIQNKIDILLTSGIGEMPFYLLKENFIDVYEIYEGISIKEIMNNYLNRQLKQIKAPTHTIEEAQSKKHLCH